MCILGFFVLASTFVSTLVATLVKMVRSRKALRFLDSFLVHMKGKEFILRVLAAGFRAWVITSYRAKVYLVNHRRIRTQHARTKVQRVILEWMEAVFKIRVKDCMTKARATRMKRSAFEVLRMLQVVSHGLTKRRSLKHVQRFQSTGALKYMRRVVTRYFRFAYSG